jgi:hypothetical protein
MKSDINSAVVSRDSDAVDEQLLKAVRSGNEQSVAAALKAGACAQVTIGEMTLPLIAVLPCGMGGFACGISDSQRARVLDLLISAGADAMQEDIDGFAPIHQAAIQGFVRCVEVLIQHLGRFAVHHEKEGTCGEDGESPLHSAARGGHISVCKLLLRKGAFIHHRDDDGYMPIDLARPRVATFLRRCMKKPLLAGGSV